METQPDGPVDMSPAAIAARLEDVRQLYRLVTSLARAEIPKGVGQPAVSALRRSPEDATR